MRLLTLITLSLAMILFARIAKTQTCESLFNTSVLSRFTKGDQEALTTLARRQVELSFNFNISKVQKDAALNHLAEQLEIFIADSRLTTQQERILRQEYRSLVFQFKKELTGEMDHQTRIASEKKKALDQQIEDQVKFPALSALMKKYRVQDLNVLLHAIIRSEFTTERNDDFKLALSINQIDVNAVDKFKRSPLSLALSKGEDPFLEILIKSPKLDVNLKVGLTGYTVFEIALGKYSKDAAEAITHAKLISSHPSFAPNSIGKYKHSLFKSAIDIYHSPEIAYIVASHPNFDIGTKGGFGRTPLHISYKHPEIVKLLISKGADLNAIDQNGRTPLHFAAQDESSSQSIELFINGGANINAKENTSYTALHLAVSKQNVKAVELLLNAKDIDINIKTQAKRTPLNIALSRNSTSLNNIKIIKILESKGATQ